MFEVRENLRVGLFAMGEGAVKEHRDSLVWLNQGVFRGHFGLALMGLSAHSRLLQRRGCDWRVSQDLRPLIWRCRGLNLEGYLVGRGTEELEDGEYM